MARATTFEGVVRNNHLLRSNAQSEEHKGNARIDQIEDRVGHEGKIALIPHVAAPQQKRRIQDVEQQRAKKHNDENVQPASAFGKIARRIAHRNLITAALESLERVHVGQEEGDLSVRLQDDFEYLKPEHLPHEVRALVPKVPLV